MWCNDKLAKAKCAVVVVCADYKTQNMCFQASFSYVLRHSLLARVLSRFIALPLWRSVYRYQQTRRKYIDIEQYILRTVHTQRQRHRRRHQNLKLFMTTTQLCVCCLMSLCLVECNCRSRCDQVWCVFVCVRASNLNDANLNLQCKNGNSSRMATHSTTMKWH